MTTSERAEMLSVRGLNAWYGSAQALFGVDLDVGSGEVVGLLGRNGAGKSSTFNAIMNLEVRSVGDIVVAGRSTTKDSPDQIARHGVAWVPEDRRIFSNLTVRENLDLARFACGDREPVTTEELLDSLPLLDKLIDRSGNQLSGGEQQLVAIARALVPRPSLLLLDEPTEGLAPLIVEQIAAAIARLPELFDVSIVLAEQNLPFVASLTSRVYVLETGRVVHHGSTPEFAADTTLQDRYLSVSVA